MTTVRKLAQLAGVSPATVSRALTNHPYVRPELRQRIIDLAELYYYRPDRRMESRLTGKTSTIGCLVPSAGSFYYSAVLQGVLDHAFSESYHVITLQTHHDVIHVQKALQALAEQRVDGVILACGHTEPIPTTSLMELLSLGAPIVSIDLTAVQVPVDQVITDEDRLAEMAVKYLYGLGHRRIAYVGPLRAKSDKRVQRGRSIRAALKRRGLWVDAMYHVDGDAETELAFRQIIRSLAHPTAIIGFGDLHGAILLREAIRQGVRVPQDISILSCGNLPIDAFLAPPLTTIDQHPEEIGRKATALLLQRIAEGERSDDFRPVTVTVPTSLIERESCAPRR